MRVSFFYGPKIECVNEKIGGGTHNKVSATNKNRNYF